MSLRVRAATVEDAQVIAEIHVESWRSAYRGLLSAEGLIALSVEARAQKWREWLASGGRTLLALERGRALAFCDAGRSRDADAGPWTAEIRAIYAREEAWGKGAGHALWLATLERLAADGAREATLWALQDNARARAFYERQGMRPDGGTMAVEIFGETRREDRFRLQLPPEPFVRGLASALDQGERARAAIFLDPDVLFNDPPCQGPEVALDAVAGRAAVPPGALQEQIRESAVQHLGGERWRINVVERLRQGGHVAAYRHALVLTLPERRAITRIQALDLPGERQRLTAFLRRVGISG